MTIWLFLWALLAIVILGFAGWTIVILLRQKKAWGNFARKHKLRYKGRGFMSSPEVSGVMQKYAVSVFGCEHSLEQGRSTRKMIAVEITLHSGMPFDGAVASGEMVEFIKTLEMSAEIKPESGYWKDAYLARSNNRQAMLDYLTDERLKALGGLMERKDLWVTFAFNDKITLLRIDTAYPLDSVGSLDKLLKELLGLAKLLELAKGEKSRLKQAQIRKSMEGGRIDIDDDDQDAPGFELENDDEDTAQSSDDKEKS